MSILLLFVGLVLLVVGAEALVRGASRLALGLGISPLIVGLTVVAFGTSSPELAVSAGAVLSGESDLSVGNVVGSNIFNALFILGISALIVPLVVAQRLIRIDVPLMVGVSLLLLLLAGNGVLGRLEGLLLASGLVAYIAFAIYEARHDDAAVATEYEDEFGRRGEDRSSLLWNLGAVAGGMALLVLGARWLVDGATDIALDLGLSDLIVGLTIVAAGTSLPEVATSMIAAMRGERDIAVGNVVGSNIFNMLGVLGISALIAGDGIAVSSAANNFDIPVMTAVAVACLPVFFTGLITRWQGLLFLAYYGAYVAYLVLNASEHSALDTYSTVMLVFALPLTALVLIATLALHMHSRSRDRALNPGQRT